MGPKGRYLGWVNDNIKKLLITWGSNSGSTAL